MQSPRKVFNRKVRKGFTQSSQRAKWHYNDFEVNVLGFCFLDLFVILVK